MHHFNYPFFFKQPSPLRRAFFRLEKMIPVTDTSSAMRVAPLLRVAVKRYAMLHVTTRYQ